MSNHDAQATPVKSLTATHHTPQHSTNEPPAVMSVAATSTFTGVSEWEIRKLIREGKIEARRHGRRVLVIRKSIIDFLDSLPTA